MILSKLWFILNHGQGHGSHLGTEHRTGTILLQCQYIVWYEIERHTKYWYNTRLHASLVLVLYGTNLSQGIIRSAGSRIYSSIFKNIVFLGLKNWKCWKGRWKMIWGTRSWSKYRWLLANIRKEKNKKQKQKSSMNSLRKWRWIIIKPRILGTQ